MPVVLLAAAHASQRWSITELSVRRYELASASLGGLLYFGGGNAGVGGSDPHAGSRVDVFDSGPSSPNHAILAAVGSPP